MLTISMASSNPHFGSSHKRPKLSLQTSSLPINYGCTSNSFPTAKTSSVAATPTTMNTFNNAYDLAYRPTTTATSSTTTTTLLAPIKPARLSRSHSPKPLRKSERPYNVPYGVKSILKNSEGSAYATASPLTGTRKVFFPPSKKVGFKLHLEEEIVNKVYTARHSDLVWDSDEDEIMESVEDQQEQPSSTANSSNGSPFVLSTKATKSRRDSGVSFSLTESKKMQPRTSYTTSTSSTRKRRRWEWTLSPVQPIANNDVIDVSGLDSEWVVVSIERERSEEPKQDPVRPTKRRATSIDAGDKPMAMRRPIRSNTL